MHHVLNELGLRLTYLCDTHSIDELDQDRILDDLSDGTRDGDPFPWLNRHPLSDFGHVILAADRCSGQYLALLCADDGTTIQDDFLLLESAFVATKARGQNLMRRMIAFALLRIAGLQRVPSVIVARSLDPLCYRTMQGMARRFRGAVLFPDPDAAAINFQAATLARRIAHAIGDSHRVQKRSGMLIAAGTDHYSSFAREPNVDRFFDRKILTVLDLREPDEGTILEDARRLYRSR